MTGSGSAGRDDARAVTPVLAVVLLIGIVAVAAVGILLVSGDSAGETKDQAETERVKQVFLQFDSDVDSVARSESDERTVRMDLPDETDAAVREETAGRIWINRTNYTTGNTETLADQSIGAVRYTRDDGTTVAYQAGGVWMEEGENTRMVSAPAFSYDADEAGNDPTLTVPIVTTSGDTRLNGGGVRVEKNRTIAPLNDVTVVENDLITLRVKSKWYVGWAEYFRQLTPEGGVTVDHGNNTATMELVVPALAPTVDSGVFSGAANSQLDLKQSNQTVDSYNSSDGPYVSSSSDDGQVAVAGDLVMKQDAKIEGDLEAGGDITFQGSAEVTGNLSNATSMTYKQDKPKEGPPHVDGWVADNASIERRTPVDGYIDLNVGTIRDDNDNPSESDITPGNKLTGCNPCELEAGRYYLDELHLSSGEELILDTTGGQIYLAVNGTVRIENSTTRVRVQGPERANVFVNGVSAGGNPEFQIIQGARWLVEDSSGTRTDAAPQSWVYLDSSGDAKLGQGSTFTGVLYGPGTPTDPGVSINVKQYAAVYGAIVGDVDKITQDTRVHYDRDLRRTEPVTTNVAIPRLTFLHVAVHEVEVEDD
ncbi:hypothetical protein BRD00_09340 [Halobacteriales archaeon QS_8_69_26]|nr:MAG: hypothetical protein BRD00_09340 [Halobacteriales archaeon QS_8_69_26]